MAQGFFNPIRSMTWKPFPGLATVPSGDGYPPLTIAGGTATARVPAATNRFTGAPRLGYVSAATAGSVITVRHAAPFVVSPAGPYGGFRHLYRFGISDAAAVATARMFIGMRTVGTALTNVSPATLTNCLGVGHDAGGTTFKFYYGGTSAQAPIDTGISCNDRSVYFHDLIITALPYEANTFHWSLRQYPDGATKADGIVTGGAAVVPQSNTLLSPVNAMRTNNTTALSVGLDLFFLELEMQD